MISCLLCPHGCVAIQVCRCQALPHIVSFWDLDSSFDTICSGTWSSIFGSSMIVSWSLLWKVLETVACNDVFEFCNISQTAHKSAAIITSFWYWGISTIWGLSKTISSSLCSGDRILLEMVFWNVTTFLYCTTCYKRKQSYWSDSCPHYLLVYVLKTPHQNRLLNASKTPDFVIRTDYKTDQICRKCWNLSWRTRRGCSKLLRWKLVALKCFRPQIHI